MTLRLLVIDAYDAAGRRALDSVGATTAGRLYARALARVDGQIETDVVEAGGPGFGELARDLSLYDGIVWTGSNLTIHRPDDLVRCQLELARAGYAAAVPQFGSCWAIQLAAVSAGGACARNPRGREFGIARAIEATSAGQGHPLLHGRPPVFEGFSSHEDMVVALPAGGVHLARNDFCEVQALEVRCGKGVFWAVQYHPEYDFREVARLASLRREQLIREGRFADGEEAATFVRDYEALHRDPANENLRRRHAVEAAMVDPGRRCRELQNWIEALEAGSLGGYP